jgi:hypothetical protein
MPWITDNVSAHLETMDIGTLQPSPLLDPTATISLSHANHARLEELCERHRLNLREGLRYLLGQFVEHGPLVKPATSETV